MEKIIHKLINNFTEGVDTYTHNGSTWLIFSESKQWVIELTESKTLWYNYNFFKDVFLYTSMDVVDNQHYITKWVEDNVINKVKDTILEKNITEGEVEEIIENGVKHTVTANNHIFDRVEDAIQNGVKHTEKSLQIDGSCVIEDTVQNGVRHTEIGWHQCNNVDDAIEYGVKETHDDTHNHKDRIEGVIENGVKVTLFNQGHKRLTVKNIIENGVRHTFDTEFMPKSIVEDIIQSGVKHTEYGDWLDRDVRLDEIIENGVKETLCGSYLNVDDVIQNGVKETKGHGFEQQNIIDDIVKDGVKETKTPGKDGDILSTIEWMEENKSTSYTKMIDDVIDNGEKINGTYAGGQRQSEKCKSVVEYGTKNPTD